MIDFHSHILPNIDDGSKDFPMSLDMLKIASDQGTKYICATPHFITGEFEISREAYDEKIKELRTLAEQEGISINILAGLEIYMHPDLPKLYKEKKIWGLNDTPYLLIEFPMEQLPNYGEDILYELRLLGARPVIAHPERNFKFLKNKHLLLNFLDQGVLCQLNAGSLRGIYGKEIKAFAETLVKNNMVHILGSDAHNVSGRSPLIKAENVASLNKELYQWMVDFQYKLIKGEELELLPIKTKESIPKKFFNLFHK